MASPSSSTLASTASDTPISIKVQFNGATHRLKLPLRDLGINAFEDKIRSFLSIDCNVPTVLERYSDSCRSFVTIAKTDTALYKQLYRAAKAKKKLRLRVTAQPTVPTLSRGSPKPATVEDEVESPNATSAPQTVNLEPDVEPEVPGLQDAQDAQDTQDAQDDSADSQHGKDQKENTEIPSAPAPGTTETVPAPRTIEEFPAFVNEWKSRGMPRIGVRRVGDDREVVDFLSGDRRVESPVKYEATQDYTRRIQNANNLTLAAFMRTAYESKLAASKAMSKSESPEAAHVEYVQPTPDAAGPSSETEDKCEESDERLKRPFTVSCNSCERLVPDVHFHCSICDDGDFDLCRDCINRGICCYGDGSHWLIRRTIADGQIKCSSTHIAPKSMRASTPPKPVAASPAQADLDVPESGASNPERRSPSPTVEPRPQATTFEDLVDLDMFPRTRTCNCCIQVFPNAEFLHCTSCDDYDLCKGCFENDQHGHHPKHGFTAAGKDAVFNYSVASRLGPGRDARHNAICDGCDKSVRGIRHKCLDCPDWDYCSDCVKDASFVHPNHRFVPIYEPLTEPPFGSSLRAIHYGICCDGPLCRTRTENKYIVGERYKCAVCHDTDFCANCEASPANMHNKTHPLLKFKTPVRHVSVTTVGEHEDGQRLPKMGDKVQARPEETECTRKHTPTENIAATPVQTVVDVHPTEQSEEKPEVSEEESADGTEEQPEQAVNKATGAGDDLVAIFKWDGIKDGSVMQPGRTFEQTWFIKNEGTVPWPAGCSVKFTGGDYMGAVDRNHPAGTRELISASQSTVCYGPLYPGRGFPFTVLMRTPDREGRFISYWRLTTPDGIKFGHKLWCDVTVEAPRQLDQPESVLKISEDPVMSLPALPLRQSGMIIPKLEHESPAASIHASSLEGEAEAEAEVEDEAAGEAASEAAAPSSNYEDDFEDCGGQDDWAEESDDGFMTDEEYDILDASDEEFPISQGKMTPRK